MEKFELVRKSKRVPKRRLLDDTLDDGNNDEDVEIRYLEKLRTSKVSTDCNAEYKDDKEERAGHKGGFQRCQRGMVMASML